VARGRPFGRGRMVSARQQRVCCYFLQGVCRLGERCRYSHVDHGGVCGYGIKCWHGHSNCRRRGFPIVPESTEVTVSNVEEDVVHDETSLLIIKDVEGEVNVPVSEMS
jgi:hypothetical protein